jgi:hypothetical protein
VDGLGAADTRKRPDFWGQILALRTDQQPISIVMLGTTEIIPTAAFEHHSHEARTGLTPHFAPNPQVRAPFGHCGYCYAKGHWKKE